MILINLELYRPNKCYLMEKHVEKTKNSDNLQIQRHVVQCR